MPAPAEEAPPEEARAVPEEGPRGVHLRNAGPLPARRPWGDLNRPPQDLYRTRRSPAIRRRDQERMEAFRRQRSGGDRGRRGRRGGGVINVYFYNN